MTKPILRLRWAEPIDDDIDPLLGRVVDDFETPSPAPDAPRSPVTPSSPEHASVFDADLPDNWTPPVADVEPSSVVQSPRVEEPEALRPADAASAALPELAGHQRDAGAGPITGRFRWTLPDSLPDSALRPATAPGSVEPVAQAAPLAPAETVSDVDDGPAAAEVGAAEASQGLAAGQNSEVIADVGPLAEADQSLLETPTEPEPVAEAAEARQSETPEEPSEIVSDAQGVDQGVALPAEPQPEQPAEPESEAQPAPPLPEHAVATVAAATTAPPPPRTGAAKDRAAAKGRPSRAAGRRPAKGRKRAVFALFGGTFLFGLSAGLTAMASLAPFGPPFDLVSAHRWSWVGLALVSALAWGLYRAPVMTGLSVLVALVNLIVIVPAMGIGASGGREQAALVGWANLRGNADGLRRLLADAEKRGATLVMVAEAPEAVRVPPAGWSLIEAPAAGDPTAIAVLSRGNDWRAATVPGEPTMARPMSATLTVIGVHPQDPTAGRRRTPARDALINRAATRAGIQDTPTLVVGDFNASAWDQSMRQFAEYGAVTRVRCGGWLGTTYGGLLGVFGLAVDHAFVRDLKVQACDIGSGLPGGHRPLWVRISPQPPTGATQ